MHRKTKYDLVIQFILLFSTVFIYNCHQIVSENWWESRNTLQREVDEMVQDHRGEIETYTGNPLPENLTIKFSSPDDLYPLTAKHLEYYFRIVLQNHTKQRIKELTKQRAKQEAPLLTGTVEASTNTVHLNLNRIKKIARKNEWEPETTRAFIQFTLIHELVHLSDYNQHEVERMFRRLKTEEEFHTLRAIVEGHAMFVTKKVLSQSEQKGQIHPFWNQMTTIDEKKLQNVQKETIKRQMVFYYRDGYQFWNHLANHDRSDVNRIFKRPPNTIQMIRNPARYVNYLKEKKNGEIAEKKEQNRIKEKLKTLIQKQRNWKVSYRDIMFFQLEAKFTSTHPENRVKRIMEEYRNGFSVTARAKKRQNIIETFASVLTFENKSTAKNAYKLSCEHTQYIYDKREHMNLDEQEALQVGQEAKLFKAHHRKEKLSYKSYILVIHKDNHVFEFDLTAFKLGNNEKHQILKMTRQGISLIENSK